MRKRVLVAHAVDTTRSIAEAVLRQNGYDVIAVPTAEKAKEVLQFARPDLILVGADLLGPDQHPFFEKIQSNPRTSSVPLLVFEPSQPMDLPFPPEVIVPQPFDPKDLIQRVMTFSGQSDAGRSGSANPLAQSPVDDDFLDAALGLDRIDVTDSEILDHTNVSQKVPQVNRAGSFGVEEKDPLSESTKVESLMIRDEKSEIHRTPAPVKPAGTPMGSGTSKLEIMSDQYGLTDPDAFQVHREDPVHDYDWFVRSMQDEVKVPAGAKAAAPTSTPEPAAPPAAPQAVPQVRDSQRLNIASTAALLNPLTPGPTSDPNAGSLPEGKNRSAGVEKFIDEFKKEIERLRSNEPESIFVDEDKAGAKGSERNLQWEETLEKITPQQMELFTRQLAQEIGEKIAEKIISRIDTDKLLQLIKAEIINHLNERGH
jgi:CheY-like chemotaxis protein